MENICSGFHCPIRKFSRNEKWSLLLATVIGAIIRIIYLHNRPFTFDEVGTLMYMEKDIPYVLSHFTTWLTMNYFIVFEKLVAALFGKGPLSLGSISLAAGIGTIPLTAFLAIRFSSSRVAIIAATLVALNPYLIRYSGIIRSYSLLASLSLLVIILFFKWQNARNYKYGIIVGAGCYILVLAHPNGVYTIAYLLFMTIVGFFYTPGRKKYLNDILTLLFPLSITLLLIIISYAKILPEMFQYSMNWRDTPPTSISYIPYIFTQYFSSGFYVWLSAGFFVAGVLISYKYEEPVAILLPSIVLPIILFSMEGLSYFPWAYGRFLIFIVPVIIIFIAEGVSHYAQKHFPNKSLLATMAILTLLILSWVPQLAAIFDEQIRFPWHKVASFLKEQCSDRDIIVGSDWLEPFHLRPYLPGKQFSNFQLGSDIGHHAGFSANSPAKIFFVTSAHFVETTYPTYHFGKIQVITYTGLGGQPVLRVIRDDLVNTVKDRKEIAPGLTAIYGNIWNINNHLGLGDRDLYYYKLWTKCSELTLRQRNIPRRLQIREANRFLKSLR